MENKKASVFFEDDKYCLQCQQFISHSEIQSHQSGHELISRNEFSRLIQINVDACIQHLKNNRDQYINSKSTIISKIEECKINYVNYIKSLNLLGDSLSNDKIRGDIVKIQGIHNDIIINATKINENNSNLQKIDDKILKLESAKNILLDELGNLNELQNFLEVNNETFQEKIMDKSEKHEVNADPILPPSKNQHFLIPKIINSTEKLDSNSNSIVFNASNHSISQLNKSSQKAKIISNKVIVTKPYIPPNNELENAQFKQNLNLPKLNNLNQIEPNQYENYTFIYDANLHYINLISLPNLKVKKYPCSLSSISFSPSFALSKSKLFMCGGYYKDSLKVSKKSFLLTWSSLIEEEPIVKEKCDLIYPRQDHAVVILGDNNAYIIGGKVAESTILRNCEKYSFRNDLWEEIQPLPMARQDFGCCTINEKLIYLIGGFAQLPEGKKYFKGYLYYDYTSEKVWKEIPLLDAPNDWIELSNMAVCNDSSKKLILFGGKIDQVSGSNSSKKCYEISLETNMIRNIEIELNSKEGDFFLSKLNNMARFENTFYFISSKRNFYMFSLKDKSLQEIPLEKIN